MKAVWAVLAAAILLVVLGWWRVSQRQADALIVYCAHDLEFSQAILDEFSERTGIRVLVVGDTEATKSLGLVERLLAERDRPRCDVFWNNQLIGTLQLADAGVLTPYQGSGWERMPAEFKDPQGLWTGFAGRLRVWIVNREKMEGSLDAVQARFSAADLSSMTVAQPLFGTTLSQFALLWQHEGEERVKELLRSLVERQCRFVPGNGTVKNLVAEGVCDFGWTDTDDYFVGVDDGFPVAMFPIRIGEKTICLPNSVAIIQGTKRRAQAEQLVDFLLSQEVELKLAHSAARQVPLGPVDESELPDEVIPLSRWARESVGVLIPAAARDGCLDWLKSEQVR